jgi:nucleotide-binding universal stress UspA family protein
VTDDDHAQRPGPHRLLVPADGSPETADALRLAVSLARGLHATLTLLGVVPLMEPPIPAAALAAHGTLILPEEEQEQVDRQAQSRLDATVAQLPHDLDVRTALGAGSAGPAIVEEAAAGVHDLIILPWHGKGTIGHLLHDRTAHHVLEHSRIPVMVVPTVPDEQAPATS